MFRKKIPWSYYEDELCCKLYIENFIINQNNMSLTEFVKLLSSKINRSETTLKMKVQNIKQIVLEKNIIDSLQTSPLAHYSPQNLVAFENLIWSSSTFQIENNILIGYNGNDEKVIIPKGIVKIGKNAFSGCDTVKHIEIPEGCLKIEYAALNCTNLKSVVFPSTLVELDRNALPSQEAEFINEGEDFIYSHKVSKDIIIFSRAKRPVAEGKDIHIYQENDKNSAMTNLRRCRYVVYFDYADLEGCTEEGLYWYKTSDGSITITGINQKKQYNIFSAPSITIPEIINGYPVNRIGDNAFERKPIYKRRYLVDSYEKLFGINSPYPSTSWEIEYDEKIILSNNIKVLGVASFKNYNGVIQLNNTLEIIGEEAFFDYNQTPTVNGENFKYLLKLPKTVNIIERCAFSNCDFSIFVPASIRYIGGFAFSSIVCPGDTKPVQHSPKEIPYNTSWHYPIICFEGSFLQANKWDENWHEGLELETIIWGAYYIKEYNEQDQRKEKLWLIITCSERIDLKVLISEFVEPCYCVTT